MKASWVVVLAVLLTSISASAQCRFSSAGVGRTVTYRFAPEATGTDLVLHITLEFQVGSKGVAEIALPLQWAGETLHAVTNLRVISDGIALADSSEEGVKQLRGGAGRTVLIAYDLKRDWAGPLTNPKQFHPVLMPEYFEFNGDNALVLPVFDDGQAVTANFDWQALPSSWAVATSFGTDTSGAQRCQTHKGPWGEVVRALFAAGDFRVHHFQIGRRPAVLAVRGQWTFSDQEAIDSIRKAVGVVRDFWRDDNFPYFLVTLKPYDRDHGMDGSAFTNAFWLYMSRLDSLSSVMTILSHETFHLWNPLRMGSLSNDAASATGWFTEGFTRYYGPLVLYNAGLLSPSDYLDGLNQDLRRFPTSNDPLLRGRVIALWLDGAIRRESRGRRSLNDVMFDMVRERKQPITIKRVFETIDRYLSADSRAEFRRAVQDRSDLIAPDPTPAVASCSQLSRENVPMFDLGFDLEGSQTSNTVTGVQPDGPAFAAGLRNGQRLNGVSVYKGDTDRLATITIRGDAGDRKIAYLPQGKTVVVWQYHLVPGQSCG